ncbi:hypothetical protein [Embleya sp. AB8]|uniref:hypothetical protein n=1 Tax=Embleya sp. AB8 TaxID=3156304 RepID=UPI003C7525AC
MVDGSWYVLVEEGVPAAEDTVWTLRRPEAVTGGRAEAEAAAERVARTYTAPHRADYVLSRRVHRLASGGIRVVELRM